MELKRLISDLELHILLLLLLSHFSHVRLCDPIDGSTPGSAVPGILQARTLEWVAISFSNAWKWKVKEKSLSGVLPSATPWTAAFQAPPAMGFSRQEYWSGVPLPSPSLPLSHLESSKEALTSCSINWGWGKWVIWRISVAMIINCYTDWNLSVLIIFSRIIYPQCIACKNSTDGLIVTWQDGSSTSQICVTKEV